MSSVSELFALKPTIHVANTLQRGLGPCYVPECSRAKIPGYLAKPWHSWWIRPTSAKLASPSVWSSADKCRELQSSKNVHSAPARLYSVRDGGLHAVANHERPTPSAHANRSVNSVGSAVRSRICFSSDEPSGRYIHSTS